jgi:hypothetical protein
MTDRGLIRPVSPHQLFDDRLGQELIEGRLAAGETGRRAGWRRDIPARPTRRPAGHHSITIA